MQGCLSGPDHSEATHTHTHSILREKGFCRRKGSSILSLASASRKARIEKRRKHVNGGYVLHTQYTQPTTHTTHSPHTHDQAPTYIVTISPPKGIRANDSMLHRYSVRSDFDGMGP